VFAGVTLIVPEAFTVPQPPVSGMLYVNVPEDVGVPLMVIVSELNVAVTPVGNPLGVPMPVAPVVVCLMLGIDVLIQTVGVVDADVTVFAGVTLIVPEAFTVPQPPVSGMLYVNVPDDVGVPLMVIVSALNEALTPFGNPLGVPMPVAPLVVCLIFDIAVLIQTVGVVDAEVTVFAGVCWCDVDCS